MRWVIWSLWLAACGADAAGDDGGGGDGTAVGTDADTTGGNDPACPTEYPALTGAIACEPDLECRWPAAGCAPGVLPDNVCRCDSEGSSWRCESYFRNCLPDRVPLGSRPTATPCADPALAPAEAACTNPSGGTCATNAACADDAVCLDVHVFGSESACGCVAAECLVDDDCADGSLCGCGTIDGDGRCGGWSLVGCAHRCVEATCRTDADCGPGGLCSPSRDACGWQVERWTCHHPSDDECLHDYECAHAASGTRCRALAADTWTCVPELLCE